MDIHKHQSQFELFPGAVRQPVEPPPSKHFFLRNLTLSLENIVVFSIVMMMGLLLSFSLGVERGKRVVRHEFAAAGLTTAQKKDTSIDKQAAVVRPAFGDGQVRIVLRHGRKPHQPDGCVRAAH